MWKKLYMTKQNNLKVNQNQKLWKINSTTQTCFRRLLLWPSFVVKDIKANCFWNSKDGTIKRKEDKLIDLLMPIECKTLWVKVCEEWQLVKRWLSKNHLPETRCHLLNLNCRVTDQILRSVWWWAISEVWAVPLMLWVVWP